MVPGDPGLTGLSVPRRVEEELRAGGDTVTVLSQHTVAETVRRRGLSRETATLTPALQVNNSCLHLVRIRKRYRGRDVFDTQRALKLSLRDVTASPSRIISNFNQLKLSSGNIENIQD